MSIIREVIFLKRVVLFLLILVGLWGCDQKSSKNTKESFKLIEGEFEYQLSSDNQCYTQKFYYSDEYFFEDNQKYNPHLASMSACLNYAIFPAYSKDDVGDHIKALLEQCGFNKDNVVVEGYETGIADNIGSVIAHKKIGDTNLLVIIPRGIGYQREWANNFKVGSGTDSEGFDFASNVVLERVEKYLKEKKIKKCIYWIVGYSRGGATANLVAGDITGNPSKYKTTAQDVYAYTFEAPNTTKEPVEYGNIFNILDNNDIVTKVPLDEWGFKRNGIDVSISLEDGMIDTRYLKTFALRDGPKVSLPVFYDSFSKLLSENISQYEYYEGIQDATVRSIDFNFRISDKKKSEIINFIVKDFLGELKTHPFEVYSFIKEYSKNKEIGRDSFNGIMGYMDLARKKSECEIDDENYEFIKDILPELLLGFRSIVVADYNYSIDDNKYPFYHLATIVTLGDEIFEYHMYDGVFDKVIAGDSYYSGN